MSETTGTRLADGLEPITLGASGLGKREGADATLADLLLASDRFHQVDTSNNYAGGASETLLGGAIARLGGLPSDRTIFSKVDSDPDTGAFDADRVRRSFDESLQRLGVETLPLLHFHDPYGLSVAEALAPGGPVEALAALRDEGLVGAIGIAAGTRALMEEYVRSDAFDAVLIHNRFTLVNRTADTVFDEASARGMAVFNAAPFGGGLLAGSTTRGVKYAYTDPSREFVAFVERLRETATTHGVDLAAAALRFATDDPRVHSVVVGISNPRRLAALDALVDAVIPDAFWDAVTELGTPPPSPAD